ncbi:MAG TPA: hypothetical protein VFJ58_00460 [Armatimonadota bacterium]|nr:hypothetical protein [Armatimonadota bacterium]
MPRAVEPALFLAAAAYLALFGLQMIYLPPLARWAMRGHLSAAASLILVAASLAAGIWVTFLAARAPTPPALSAALMAAFAFAWALLTFAAPVRWLNLHAWWITPYVAVRELSLALGAAFLGRAVAPAFKDRNLVAAGALVGAAVDFWGVNFGTTRAIITHMPALHQRVSVHLPHLGHLTPLVGPGDYVFIGIMFALAHRHNLNPVKTAWLMWALLFAAMVGVLLAGWSVPAVVPMAIAVILPNVAEFRFKRDELFALLYAGALLGALAFGWWFSHRGK